MATDVIVSEPTATAERFWHYVADNSAQGPISQGDMVQMIAEGRLSPDTLVWSESMPDWAPAGRIDVFQGHFRSLPLVMPQPVATLRQRAEAARAQGVPQVRPWVGYFARICDLWICGLTLGVLLGIAEVAADVPEFVLGLAVPFLWVFVEALLLSTWGTTPGKRLLGTWVADAMGNRLSFSDALSRSFSVWFIGLGFGLPIISLITSIASYCKLTGQGLTSWDRDGRFAVIHERIGVVRVLAMIVLFLVFAALMVLGQCADEL